MDDLTNLNLIEEKYALYLQDPTSVDPSWRYFFNGIEFIGKEETLLGKEGNSTSKIWDAYRLHGHLLAHFDPLNSPPSQIPELEFEAPLELLSEIKKIYCGKIGFQCTNLAATGLEEWIQQRIEKTPLFEMTSQEKIRIGEMLNRSEVFENFLHTKYQGQTRFSLEGNDALIPMLQELVIQGAESGVKGFVLGMAHRGRLNVLTNILNKPYAVLFKEFEDAIPYIPGEGGDVKYHKGFSSDVQVGSQSIHLHLCANSSCLESVDGIVLGQTKAKQIVLGDESFGAILMHGDGALAGQGVVYETLQMSKLKGFSTGGTIHIAIDNQIGYTTLPEEGRSTRYCTDIAKMFGIPVFHVNGEDPEGCVFAARLALEIRLKFRCDVFINLHGYRKYGHNEGDEPSFTQPLHYQMIRNKKSVKEIYLKELLSQGLEIPDFEQEFKEALNTHFEKGKIEEDIDLTHRFGSSWKDFSQPPNDTLFNQVETKVEATILKALMGAYAKIPDGFKLHPKLVKWLEDRRLQLEKDPKTSSIDWGAAECLAFSSLLSQGVSIRLAGQDVKRGTFSHRHAVWFDQVTAAPYEPFSEIAKPQGRFDVHNTLLSEYGALAFEFGYSWVSFNGLVIWEAQYGDFDIGAQTIIDHYLVSAEQKWAKYSSLVMLLPHGYEGAGPEHSSARPERFLQLAAGENIQVVSPSTPSQFFHLLRRQVLRKIKKPLIVLTPKSLLRLPACTSSLSEFTEGSFQEILDDPKGNSSQTKLIFCSGKIYYDILASKEIREDTALIRIEQFYPFHSEKFQSIVSKYIKAKTWVYVQEEPENMGAGEFLLPYLKKHASSEVEIHFIGRARSGATATGSRKRHLEEQAKILKRLYEILSKRVHGS